MSETQKAPHPEQLRQAGLRQEQLELLDIQTAQADVLIEAGIIDKAWNNLQRRHEVSYLRKPDGEIDYNNPIYPNYEDGVITPCVSTDRTKGGTTEWLGITFKIRKPSPGSASMMVHPRTIGVATVKGGTISPASGFTPEDVDQVVGMVRLLEDARTQGILPNLSADVTDINDPRTGRPFIDLLPPIAH